MTNRQMLKQPYSVYQQLQLEMSLRHRFIDPEQCQILSYWKDLYLG